MTKFDPYPLVDRLKTASIVDGLGKMFQHRAYILDLVTPTPGKKLFGQAVTISFLPFREDLYDEEVHNFARMFYKAVGDAPKGKVLVMASNGYPDTSMGGGMKLSRAHNHGIAGVLSDARFRDFDELRRYDFVTYCNGEATSWGGNTITPSAANVPVSFRGVAVHPGDYVFADSSGAAVIPGSVLQEVLEEAVRYEERSDEEIEKIRREDPAVILKHGDKVQ